MAESSIPIASMPAKAHRSNTQRSAHRFLRNPLAVLGLGLLLILAVAAAWPVDWLPHNPYRTDLELRFVPPVWMAGGQTSHILGTDALGRDMLSIIMHGLRYSLTIIGLAESIALLFGVFVGLVAGYYRGAIDEVAMRIVDISLAFPSVVLVIAIVAALGPNLQNLILVLGITSFPPFARIVRGVVLSLREKEFVQAARSVGARDLQIMRRHLLPSCATSIIIYTTFDLAKLLLAESSLSFLGLGVQPPIPSLGLMIADGRQHLYEAWWASALPGIAIVLVVLGFNFLGDGLRDMFDPRGKQV